MLDYYGNIITQEEAKLIADQTYVYYIQLGKKYR